MVLVNMTTLYIDTSMKQINSLKPLKKLNPNVIKENRDLED